MFGKVFRDLFAHKMRTVLVVLSVATGVFGVSAVAILSGQLGSAINSQYFRSNPPDITLSTSPISGAVIRQLDQTPNVRPPIEGRITAFAHWRPSKSLEDIQIVGFRNFGSHNVVGKTILKQGSFPGPGQVLFETTGANEYNIRVGQKITVMGAHGTSQLTVSGWGDNSAYQPAKTAGYATVFLDFPTAIKLTGVARANTLLVKLHNNRLSAGDKTAAALRGRLGQDGAVVNSVSVADPSNPPGNNTSALIGALLGVFAVVALITSSFLVINTISTVVAEQRGQIGSMKAVGATTGMVMRIYLLLALLYGAMGTVAGLILGIGGSYVLLQLLSSMVGFQPGPFSVSPVAIVLGIVVGIGVSLLAAILPVWLGSRVTIREAIMSYGLGSNFGRGIVARLVMTLAFLPVSLVLASRNLVRNRTRVILTIVGLAIAGACIISVSSTQSSLVSALDVGIKTYKADILVQPNAPVQASRLTRIINTVPGVQYSEGWFATGVQNGDHLADVLNGLPYNTRVYNLSRVVQGRWFRPGDVNVVLITEQMARNRKYHVGEVLTLGIGQNVVHWKVIGVVRDFTSGDSSFFAPINQASRAAGAPPGIVQQALVKLTDSSRANVARKSEVISHTLAAAGIAPRNTLIYKVQDQITSQFSILFVLLYAVVLVVAVVGALGLFGTITMNVLERRREIGVMRSVGAPTKSVLMVFLSEGLLLGLVGWLLAILLGVFGAQLLASLISSLLVPLTVSITPASVVVTLIAISLVAFLAALFPSIKAARTKISDVLRYA